MNKDTSLFASVECESKTLYVYGYMPAEELKKIEEDFRNGVDVRHAQVAVRERESVLKPKGEDGKRRENIESFERAD